MAGMLTLSESTVHPNTRKENTHCQLFFAKDVHETTSQVQLAWFSQVAIFQARADSTLPWPLPVLPLMNRWAAEAGNSVLLNRSSTPWCKRSSEVHFPAQDLQKPCWTLKHVHLCVISNPSWRASILFSPWRNLNVGWTVAEKDGPAIRSDHFEYGHLSQLTWY